MYVVRDQPRKLEIGTPKYPPPCVQIQVLLIVDAIGSRERSQSTIMNDATKGTATEVKIVDPRRTLPARMVDNTKERKQKVMKDGKIRSGTKKSLGPRAAV